MAEDNEFHFDPKHGANAGDYWTGNSGQGNGSLYRFTPTNISATAIFEPSPSDIGSDSPITRCCF